MHCGDWSLTRHPHKYDITAALLAKPRIYNKTEDMTLPQMTAVTKNDARHKETQMRLMI